MSLEYGPGKAWVAGKPATEQDLDGHFAYVTEGVQHRTVLAAGPIVGTDHGRYLLAAPDRAAVDDFVAQDPGNKQRVLTPVSIRPWFPANRQNQADAAEKAKQVAP